MQDWTKPRTRQQSLRLHLTLGEVAEAVAIGEASVGHANRSEERLLRAWSSAPPGLMPCIRRASRRVRERCSRRLRRSRRNGSPKYPRLVFAPGLSLLRSAARPGPRRRGARSGGADARDWQPEHSGRLLTRAGSPLPRPGGAGAGRAWRGQGAARPGGRRPAPSGRHQLSALAACWRARRCSGRPATFRRASARSGRGDADREARRDAALSVRCPSRIRPARARGGQPGKAREHVAEAKRLVEKTGYGRRRPEVEALEAEVGELG